MPGWIEGTFAIVGETAGLQITPDVIPFIFFIPLFMAFLPWTLRDSLTRWVNIIGGIVFIALATIGLNNFLSQRSAWAIVVWLSQFGANTLIVWYAWKSKQKA